MIDLTEDRDVKTVQLTDDGRFPNHPRWPLLLYRQVAKGGSPLNPSDLEKLLESNNWSGCWRNGVFPIIIIIAMPMNACFATAVTLPYSSADPKALQKPV